MSMATNTLCTCILLRESECAYFGERQYIRMYVRGCDLVTGHSLCACVRIHSLYFDVVDDRVVYRMFKYRRYLNLLSLSDVFSYFCRHVFFGNTHNPQKCIFYGLILFNKCHRICVRKDLDREKS